LTQFQCTYPPRTSLSARSIGFNCGKNLAVSVIPTFLSAASPGGFSFYFAKPGLLVEKSDSRRRLNPRLPAAVLHSVRTFALDIGNDGPVNPHHFAHPLLRKALLHSDAFDR
jgi:hypothetical protein